MVKLTIFVSLCIVLIALTKQFAKPGMIKKRAIMLGPIFDPALQSDGLIMLYMYINLEPKK